VVMVMVRPSHGDPGLEGGGGVGPTWALAGCGGGGSRGGTFSLLAIKIRLSAAA
jgi:hypothetical protein